MLKRGVYCEREGYILGGSHIVVEKGGIFREKEVYSWRVAHNIHLFKWGIFWEGGVDSGGSHTVVKKEIYSGREG